MQEVCKVTIIATAFNEKIYNRPFVESLLNQADPNWKTIIYHNGSNQEMSNWVNSYNDNRVVYVESVVNSSQWGCKNRQTAIDTLVTTPFVVNTSIQDYYLPCFIQELNDILKDTTIDLIHWQAINHLFRYHIINGEFAWGHIDWGQFCCRTEHIKKTGIVHPDNFSGDFHTLQAVRQYVKKVHKIDKVLTIHN